MNYTRDLFNSNIKGQRSKNIAGRQRTQKNIIWNLTKIKYDLNTMIVILYTLKLFFEYYDNYFSIVNCTLKK